MNAAFSGNTEHRNKLEKTYQKIQGNQLMYKSLNNTKPESDWKARLLKYKR